MAAPPPDQLPRLLAEMMAQLEVATALALRLDARPFDDREMIRQIEAAGRAARAALGVNAVPLPAPGSPSSTSSDPPSDKYIFSSGLFPFLFVCGLEKYKRVWGDQKVRIT
jgi:hypothetical protein